MAEGHRLGRRGEDLACLYLQMCGFRCLARRFRRPGGEIDLVMARGETVVFVEVKTRGRSSPAPPEAWVSPRQMQRLRRLARVWLSEQTSPPGWNFRFDVVAVEFAGEERGCMIRHLAGC